MTKQRASYIRGDVHGFRYLFSLKTFTSSSVNACGLIKSFLSIDLYYTLWNLDSRKRDEVKLSTA